MGCGPLLFRSLFITNVYYVSPSRSRYDAFMFSFATCHPRELEVQPPSAELEVQPLGGNESKEDKAEDAGVHTPCMVDVLHARTGVLSEHLSDWVKGSALRALKAAEGLEGGDMKEVMTAEVPEWFQQSHLRWSETAVAKEVAKEDDDTTAVAKEAGRVMIILSDLPSDPPPHRISPCAAIVDARAAVKERKKKEGEMRATRVKQELEMAIQGTEGHGGCFFVAERREDGVVRPNEMNRNMINSIHLLCV